MSSETSSPPDPQFLAAAAQRRSVATRQALSSSELLRQHEQRQKFRRLIDPGIFRPNSQEAAMASLKVYRKILLKISENLIREPENPKFRQFKSTNDTIRRCLIETKGGLEYAIEMGFRPEVKDFQPLYVWNERKSEELHLGAQMLRETITLAEQKSAKSQKSAAEVKAATEAATRNALLAFMDDRKTKMLRDQRDRHNREVRALHSPSVDGEGTLSPSPPPSNPGSGHVLSSPDPVVVDEPSPYHD